MPDYEDASFPLEGGPRDPTSRGLANFSERTGINISSQNPALSIIYAQKEASKYLSELGAFHNNAIAAGRLEQYRPELTQNREMLDSIRTTITESLRHKDPMSSSAIAGTQLLASINRIDQRLEKSLNPQNEPGGASDIRSSARVARSYLRDGGELPQHMRDEFSTHLETLSENVARMQEEFMSGNLSQEERRRLSMQIASESNLAQELRNILEYHTKENKDALDSVMGLVSNVAGAMGAGALMSSLLIQDPFQFRFTPAMNVMGQQGEVGAALSQAMMQEEQYDIQFNQMALMGGAGAAWGGARMFRGGNRWAGGALAGVGAGLAIMGGSGGFNDILQGLRLRASEEEIIGQNLAQQLADPQRLLGRFQSSRVGLLNTPGAGANLGFLYNDAARGSLTGNAVTDRIMTTQRLGGAGSADMSNEDTWRRLGYSGEDVGRMLSTIASSVVGSPEDFAGFVAEASAAYGMDPSAMTSLLATAQRGGSRNALNSVQTAMGATADEQGRVSNYAMQVLVPALMKVTESMAIRNISRNTEELEREVYSLRSSMGRSDNNLGRLINTNPEAFSRVMQTIETGVKGSLDDPARLAFDMMLGNNVGDILQGRASVMGTRLDAMMNMMGGRAAFRGASFDQMVSNPYQLMMLQNMAGLSGIQDVQMLFQMMQMQAEGNFVSGDGALTPQAQRLVDEAKEGGRSEVEERALQIINTELGETMANLSKQVDAMYTASAELMQEMQDVQKDLLTIVQSEELQNYAKAAMERIIAALRDALDIPNYGPVQDPTFGTSDATQNILEEGVRRELRNTELPGQLEMMYPKPDIPEQFRELSYSELATMVEGLPGYEGMTDQGLLTLNGRDITLMQALQDRAVGGFTGRGGRMDVAGVIHGGEYVISDNNVWANKEILDRIQSGERMQETRGAFNSSTTETGGTTTLTIRMSGMNVSDIYNLAQKATEDYVVRNRIIYD